MHYFKYFPTVTWEDFIDGVHEKKTVVNLTAYTTIASKLIDDVSYYSYVTIPQGDRPDNLSYSLYGTTDYYWTFFVINDHLRNLYTDWPMTDSQLMDWVESKYPGIAIYPSSTKKEYSDAFYNLQIGDVLTTKSNDSNLVNDIYVEVTGLNPTNGWFQVEYTDNSLGKFTLGSSVVYQNTITITTSIDKSDLEESFEIKGISEVYNAPHHYENEYGDIINVHNTPRGLEEVPALRHVSKSSIFPSTYKPPEKIETISFSDYEKRANINRSYIRVIKPEFIKEVTEKFRLAMKEQQE
jgi:hypothetical protein